MKEIENKLIYAQTVISAREMTIELLTGVDKLRENYNCDALGQLREMVITTRTVVTVNNQAEWVVTIFRKRLDDGQEMEAWISARKRTMRNLRAVKHEVTEVQNVNHLVMLLAGSSTTFNAEVKVLKTQSNIYFSLDS